MRVTYDLEEIGIEDGRVSSSNVLIAFSAGIGSVSGCSCSLNLVSMGEAIFGVAEGGIVVSGVLFALFAVGSIGVLVGGSLFPFTAIVDGVDGIEVVDLIDLVELIEEEATVGRNFDGLRS